MALAVSGITSRQYAVLLEAVLRLEGKVDALAVAVDRTGPRDRQRARLVVTMAARVGARSFTAADLLKHARPEVDPDLGAALADCLIDSPKQLGRELRRLEGRPIAGFIVERVADGRDGIAWRVRVSGVST